MSWSLRLQHGDLALSGASFGTVINEQKLVQDLRCWILEQMGTDSLHPGYGSLIDGGVKSDGTIVDSIIGDSDLDMVLLRVESELQRIVAEYQGQQLSRAKADRLIYNKATLTLREVLLAVTNIQASASGTSLNVVLSIQTAAGRSLDFTVALPTDSTFTSIPS
jgi:hypothetical protein